jgi:hypothetical protein
VPPQAVTVSISCTGAPITPPAVPLQVNPSNYSYLTSTCVNKTSNFVVTGGTPPYTVFFASGGTGATITPTTLTASGQGFTVTGLTDTALTTNITVVDSSTPQVQVVVTITCPTGSSSPAMAVEPAGGYTYAITVPNPTPPPATLANGCSTKQSNFVITGGTPPYTATCALGGTTCGVVQPTNILASGQGFAVTGVADIPRINQITIKDSSVTQQVLVRTITCTP